eukprot:CAMPEP_0198238038 /NCGR_PEP_ID=MMETSP1446-20131203/3771_1 /TAXON_ID=1461542 ORGANISM="Unidentified sp, Strain CCMP2111" /NCGR_SAMPLE_ID=MMETSP1446 /ASSEMBLY_ACC=CAM_ASM_001112 /LENGTH=123 /DNA_ID=CAMNT_0043920353 /DNA_START=132 /DNA_END=499 /DNA_ORIENTATION=-
MAPLSEAEKMLRLKYKLYNEVKVVDTSTSGASAFKAIISRDSTKSTPTKMIIKQIVPKAPASSSAGFGEKRRSPGATDQQPKAATPAEKLSAIEKAKRILAREARSAAAAKATTSASASTVLP